MGRPQTPSRQEMALVGITAIWGSTFVVVHLAVQHSGPWFFVGIRFLAAGLIAAAIFHRSLRRISARDLVAGVSIGVCLFSGYGLQTFGLQTITASTSAFITALYVPLVPLLQWAAFRKPPGRMALLGVTLAFVGLVLLAGPEALRIGFGPGETATLIGAVAMAAEIVLIGVFAGRVSLGNVTIIQLLTAGALGLMTFPLAGESVPAFSWGWLAPALGMAAASCLIQLTMNWAQRSVSPTRATIIYAGEPVWGGIFGWFYGDRLGVIAVVGAACIVASNILSELKPGRRAREVDSKRGPTEHPDLEEHASGVRGADAGMVETV
ncbi:drug/metabolite transporter (DMT)-like permease [Ornithinicoccus hortensis]|uniref:Drug/metabolite transporter (DMT)-like permease n=1 Tax=Ornithinicoccus hortensis TaxID=82346 RepID=A0A542YT18_9MICO|nr:drug/metabolite transporter (DMT)-like permease [Ornithinicoccus hortensis]